MSWTEKQLDDLKQRGKIRDFSKPHNISHSNKIVKIEKRSIQKEWLSLNLTYWANEHAVSIETEYRFDEVRKWRFDW